MCLGGGGNKAAAVDPGDFDAWYDAKSGRYKNDNSKASVKPQWQKLKNEFDASEPQEAEETIEDIQEEQEAEIEEAEKTEAVKVEEVKEKVMEEKAETFTAPVSTLPKDTIQRKRQLELSQDIEAPAPITRKSVADIEAPADSTAPKKIVDNAEPPKEISALNETMVKMVSKVSDKAAEEDDIKYYADPDSYLKPSKRKQKQMDLISGLSRRRSKAKGRRSLITGKSGGGIGYYNKYFT